MYIVYCTGFLGLIDDKNEYKRAQVRCTRRDCTVCVCALEKKINITLTRYAHTIQRDMNSNGANWAAI
jgi:hypothetical protein